MAAVAAPAVATTYSAKLTAPSDGRIVAREINWACAGDTCQGATAESRPAVLCQALAKRAGKVQRFLVDGRAFSDAELARCNAAAKAQPEKALAAQ
jgi:hypothetical protein